MPFSDAVRDLRFVRAGAMCECTDPGHGHDHRRCFAVLLGDWEAHHELPEVLGGPDIVENCRALCKRCHDLKHGRLGLNDPLRNVPVQPRPTGAPRFGTFTAPPARPPDQERGLPRFGKLP